MISKPSKSAEKREAIALKALGEQLINLSNKELNSIHLNKRLHQAVVDAKSIRARGALKRQKKLIGKLMRKIDPIPIRAAIDRFNKDEQREKIIFKKTDEIYHCHTDFKSFHPLRRFIINNCNIQLEIF